jgi:acyl carrier protein
VINKKRLIEIVLEMIELDSDMNESTMVAEDKIANWDSLTHLSILVTLDKVLGGKASSIDSLAACSDTDELFEVLQIHGLAV